MKTKENQAKNTINLESSTLLDDILVDVANFFERLEQDCSDITRIIKLVGERDNNRDDEAGFKARRKFLELASVAFYDENLDFSTYVHKHGKIAVLNAFSCAAMLYITIKQQPQAKHEVLAKLASLTSSMVALKCSYEIFHNRPGRLLSYALFLGLSPLMQIEKTYNFTGQISLLASCAYLGYQSLKDFFILKNRIKYSEKLLQESPDLLQNSSEVVLFSNPLGKRLKVNAKSYPYLQINQEASDKIRSYPNFFPRALRSLYSEPTAKAPGGVVAGFNLIVNGQTNFDGDLIYIGGELLIAPGSNGSWVRLLYDSVIRFEMGGVFTIHNDDHKLQAKQREEVALFYLFKKLMAEFEGPGHGELKLNKELEALEVFEVTSIIFSKRWVCRHGAVLLAKFIQFAINDGLLTGYCKFRSSDGLKKGEPGHAWLEYHNPVLFDQGDYYLIDPVNYVCSFRSQCIVSEEFIKFENNSQLPRFNS